MAVQSPVLIQVSPRARMLGTILAFTSGFVAVAADAYVERSPGPLWGLLFVFGLTVLVNKTKGTYRWQPLVRGLVVIIAWVLAAGINYCGHAGPTYTLACVLLVILLMLDLIYLVTSDPRPPLP